MNIIRRCIREYNSGSAIRALENDLPHDYSIISKAH
jgi:hypothetical protein